MIGKEINYSDLTFSVSDINNVIKEFIEGNSFFKKLKVKGELQGFKKSSTGHYFFYLKDEESVISCVIYSFSNIDDLYSFKDGDLVEVTASLGIFNKRGTYNLRISSMKKAGLGDILLKKKMLLEKLNAEGLLRIENKRPIPKFPKHIGIVTSETGAALQDMLKNINARMSGLTIHLFPCLVQGKGAPISIEAALLKAAETNVDVLIIGRGGGSSDDLSAFDDERVARALSAIKVPTISAVGHEIDFSVTDYVADLRVSTPTQAAIQCVQNKYDLLDYFNDIELSLKRTALQKIENENDKITYYKNFLARNDINTIIAHRIDHLNSLESLINIGFKNYLNSNENRINNLEKILNNTNYINKINNGIAVIKNNNGIIVNNLSNLQINDEIIIESSEAQFEATIKRRIK